VHLDFPSFFHCGNRGSSDPLRAEGPVPLQLGRRRETFQSSSVHFRHLTTCIQIQEIVINKNLLDLFFCKK
jgi:hypothetical protein